MENSRKPTFAGQARCGSSCVEKYIFKSKQLYHLFHQITKCTYNAIDNKNIFEKLFGSILLLFYRYSKLALLNSQLQLVLPCPPLQVYIVGVYTPGIAIFAINTIKVVTLLPVRPCVCAEKNSPHPPPRVNTHTHSTRVSQHHPIH